MKDVVFFLHRVYPKGRKDDISISNFVRALKLIKLRFKIVPLEELLEEKSKERRAAITFDDGYADNFVYAYPILKKIGIKAHLFITSGRMGNFGVRKTLEDYWEGKASLKELFQPKSMFEAHVEFLKKGKSQEFLSWEEIERMKDVFTFGAHGKHHLSHPISDEITDFYDGKNFHWSYYVYSEELFIGLPRFKTESSLKGRIFFPSKELLEFCRKFKRKDARSWKKDLKIRIAQEVKEKGRFESTDEAKERIKTELSQSKREIENRLGLKVNSFAWPFGQYSSLSKEIAGEIYRYVFTIKKGLITEEADPLELPRVSLGKDIFTVLGRVFSFSTDVGFRIYKLFKGEKTI